MRSTGLPLPDSQWNQSVFGEFHRHDRLGGLADEYYQAAACAATQNGWNWN